MSTATTLSEYFILDHRRSDKYWSAVEEAAENDDSNAACAAWNIFQSAQRHHLSMEEELLFPAIEQATGMSGGPTDVMRMEHEQMRGVLDQMSAAVDDHDFQQLLDLGDTLLILVQQHNEKEEGMLYPMAEEALGADWAQLQQQLDGIPYP